MEYIEDDWIIRRIEYRPKGMSVPEPISYMEFEYKHGNILIRYGEEKSQAKNKSMIIDIIELL